MAQWRLKGSRRAKSRTSLELVREALRPQFPTLHGFQLDGHIVVRGSIPLISGGRELTRYQIEILITDDQTLPSVREIGNRIPSVADRHVSADGTLCLGVPEDLWPVWGRSFNLREYLDGPVRDFLLGNTLVEQGEAWPHGEWAHGLAGICQYYAERLGTSEPAAVYRLLQCLSRKRIKGHWNCPCGSRKKLRHCHFRTVIDLQQYLAPQAVLISLEQLRANLEPHRKKGNYGDAFASLRGRRRPTKQ
jgi:hypothetical protein